VTGWLKKGIMTCWCCRMKILLQLCTFILLGKWQIRSIARDWIWQNH